MPREQQIRDRNIYKMKKNQYTKFNQDGMDISDLKEYHKHPTICASCLVVFQRYLLPLTISLHKLVQPLGGVIAS